MIELEENLVSNCCGAGVWQDNDICNECYEHCKPVSEEEYYEGEEFWVKWKDLLWIRLKVVA